ncbi:ATP-dependent DNA/RNA helicase DHX36-like isoform X1 [Acropora palmata]|uniref:ATP-dependent DNA/RNA helicase DHX36-like isoform X1 n=1 Tax=Acropora palmata TaxID=6131 RepID=UPI003DA09D7A
MQRNLRACFRSIGIVIRTCNFSDQKDFVAVHVGKMHKGGVRNKADFSNGRGRRHGKGRHPSGLSGNEIGMWYAAKANRKRKERDLKQRAYVTMDNQHEERINELLGAIRTGESNVDYGNANSGSSNSQDELSQGYNAHDTESSSQDGCDSSGQSSSLSVEGTSSDVMAKGGASKAIGGMENPWQCIDKEDEMEVDEVAGTSTMRSDVFGNELSLGGASASFDESSRAATFIKRSLHQDSVLDQSFKEEQQQKLTSKGTRYAAMQEFRRKLPAYDMREELLKLIKSEQVLVISGETGCGKTTQVAQFILDDAIEQGCGSTCRVICTQPRRISAISVAERVAAERGESCGGNSSVGFQIRLESKLPREQGSILYCTTGILLRWLVSDPLLSGTSHIILDEIHERDVLSDFLLIIVRDLLLKRPDLKLVLMSATLNSEMFSSYFGNCKMAHIPGFTYPVQEFYLEEIIEKTGYHVDQDRNQRAQRPEPKWKKYRDRGTKSLAKDNWIAKSQQEDKEMMWKHHLDSIQHKFSPRTIATLNNMYMEKIDLDLVVRVVTHISLHMEEGAILVFLPGWDDISKVHDKLKEEKMFSSDKFRIIPLHSMMPSTNQKEVFDRPPEGVRKIVIATNIAETSITIDDVVFVVDGGKVKEKTYDVQNKIACLQPVWISKASSRQRRGRAGRVQLGYCFHLFTKYHADTLEDYQLPEMLRTPLEELCLQIKILKLGMIRPFLAKALQPPEDQAVINALEVLHQLNALDANEELTPLGYHLATLPVDPRVGKLILFGAIFSCLDPVLTVASVLGFKDPFVSPLGKQKEAERARAYFAGDTRSDHLALLRAFQGWEQASRGGREREFCWRNFLSGNTMKMIKDMKQQFSSLLRDIGFLDSSDPKATSANHNSENLKLVKAILCAGLYPNVAKIEHHRTFKRPPILRTLEDGRVYLHPKSVNAQVIVFEDNFLIYHEKMKSSSLFLYDSTMIAPFPLLFFGGDITVFKEEGQETVAVDDFIKFKSPTRIANLVKELRVELDKLLKQKIAEPKMKLSAGTGVGSKENALLRAIIDLITSEENSNWRKQRAMADYPQVMTH